MNVALWIATGLLAFVALMSGTIKTVMPQAKLAEAPGGQWTAGVSAGAVKALGLVEILAAVGLILPAVLDIAPVLVPVTAVCWIALMIGAIITHLRHRDGPVVVLNLIYLALAVFIVVGRFGIAPF
ncbi:DoxX family protein [Nocardia sp. NPDC052001]|uniref:DoxX family protein n=1 Tax=Nocardia sp. NPDC052001 TaxID=3154853 RepID=UPI0034312060